MLHHLMCGTWTPPGAIFTLQFDDEALTLKLIKKTDIPHDEPISWMTFDHDKKNIYGAAMKKWSSFAVKSPTEIIHTSSHSMDHDRTFANEQPKSNSPPVLTTLLTLSAQASSSSTKTRAIFVLAAQKPPYAVYGNPFYEHAGAGNIFSVESSGALSKNIQNYAYSPSTAIHGTVFDPTETYLYSADMWANKIWTHKKDAETGTLETVGSLDAPKPGDHPRWVAMHPKGHYLYALMEGGNSLGVYVIDDATHLPVYTHLSYPLIPPNLPPHTKLYRSDVIALTHSGRHMFATARSNDFSIPGYISAFRLGEMGNIEKQIFCQPTPTSGGHSNAVSCSDWCDDWVALCDDQEGWVEVYRWDAEKEWLARVARCVIDSPGAAMNAIWYD